MSAPPIPYSRQATFTQFSTEQFPTTGQGLEGEFNKISQSIGTTQSRLAEIQRDDGRLRNLAVTFDTLGADVTSLLATRTGQVRGAWAAGSAYAVGDVVSAPAGGVFVAGITHIATNDFEADVGDGKWLSIDAYIAPGPGAVARTKQRKLEETISLKDYGAVGDGVTDDSAAFAKFIAACMALGVTGVITSGNYYVPSLTQTLLTAPISVVGQGPTRPILSGNKTVASYAFCLTQHEAHFENIEFRDFIDVFTAGNGSGGSMPSTVTGNVSAFSLSRVGFRNCRRAVFFFINKGGPSLGSLRITDCDIDGETTGWAGLFCAWTNISGVVDVSRNVVRNIDATAAGFTSGGAPANVGNGRAIIIGGNNPPTDYAMARWSVCDNLVENITDSRAHGAGVNPEVGGIRVTGARFVEICRNRLANIASTGSGVTDDCEGIYPKAAYSIICNNVLDNVGQNGGAIYVKGYNRVRTEYDPVNPSADGWSGVMIGNIVRRTDGKRSCGISIYSSDWIVENNYVEGCGGDSTRYAPIWVNADQNDNVVLRGNTVKDAIGLYGILCTAYGKNIRIEQNIIDGVLCSYSGLSNSHSYGIYVLNANSNGYNTGGIHLTDMLISGNVVGGVVTMSGQQSRAIAITSNGSETDRLRILDNVIASACTVGVQIQAGTYNGLTIHGNDLRLAATPYGAAGSPSVTDWAASGNIGWLSGSLAVDPPSVGAGATIEVGTVAIPNASSRDVVRVTSSASLQGMILWGTVTATGTVTIYLFNPTGGSINMSSSTFRVTVEKFVA